MNSWASLPAARIRGRGVISTAFLNMQHSNLRDVAQFVCGLPYGRNSNPEEPLIVLLEKRGTCSTKHALLRRLALEQRFDLRLILGIYEMTGQNTPGVGPILDRYRLKSLPEAHCFLRSEEKRIDITKDAGPIEEPVIHFLHEEEIDPRQIAGYKVGIHKKFLRSWIAGRDDLGGLSLEKLWAIREECIAALSKARDSGQLFKDSGITTIG